MWAPKLEPTFGPNSALLLFFGRRGVQKQVSKKGPCLCLFFNLGAGLCCASRQHSNVRELGCGQQSQTTGVSSELPPWRGARECYRAKVSDCQQWLFAQLLEFPMRTKVALW
jgi:hypothetical protein